LLLPPSMTDWLAEDHLVWFVIEAVGQLDTSAFHARAKLGGVGRRGFDPDMLLTLLVYAMAHGVRSSRQIERLCHSDVAFRIICANDVPDHTVVARFRQDHEAALADLLTATLGLCARLGMVRLGVVAFDGVKIAANASRDANRGEAGLRRLAEEHLAAAAATDTAEDALFGDGQRGDELPRKLRDRSGRGRRIRQALQEIAQAKAAEQAHAQAAAEAVACYEHSIGDPDTPPAGRAPGGVDAVAVAKARWQRERARAQARLDDWEQRARHAAATRGHKLRGSRPAAPDEHRKVEAAWAAYEHARATTTTTTGQAGRSTAPTTPTRAGTDEPRANLTDPDSRLLNTRNGWVQGYNCQTAASEDQFILHAEPTQDANDVQQFQPTTDAVCAAAAHLAEQTGREDLRVGTMIGDAGYDSDANLTADGPDRLIAGAKRHIIDQRAATNPTTGNPPEHATARQRMNHRLRTPEGHHLYKRRAPLIEAPHSWLKDRRGLRQFTRRGLTAARSELRFAAAVTNLLRLHTLGITTKTLATTG
jgi:transposase